MHPPPPLAQYRRRLRKGRKHAENPENAEYAAPQQVEEERQANGRKVDEPREAYNVAQHHIQESETSFLTLLRHGEVTTKAETLTRFNTRGLAYFCPALDLHTKEGAAAYRYHLSWSDSIIGKIQSKTHNQPLDTDFWFVADPDFEKSSAMVLDQGRPSVLVEGVLAMRDDVSMCSHPSTRPRVAADE